MPALPDTFSTGDALLVVVLEPQVGDQLLTAEVPQSVFELHQLDEQVVFGIESRGGHRRFQVEAQPFLDAQSAQLVTALGKIEKEYQVKHDGGGKNGIPAEKIHFDLHGIAQPTKNIDVV